MFLCECESCGNRFIIKPQEITALVCPKCGAPLKIVEDLREKNTTPYYFPNYTYEIPYIWEDRADTVTTTVANTFNSEMVKYTIAYCGT